MDPTGEAAKLGCIQDGDQIIQVSYFSITFVFGQDCHTLYADDCSRLYIYRVGQKTTHQTLGHNSVKSLKIFKKFSSGRFYNKFAVKWLLRLLRPSVL